MSGYDLTFGLELFALRCTSVGIVFKQQFHQWFPGLLDQHLPNSNVWDMRLTCSLKALWYIFFHRLDPITHWKHYFPHPSFTKLFSFYNPTIVMSWVLAGWSDLDITQTQQLVQRFSLSLSLSLSPLSSMTRAISETPAEVVCPETSSETKISRLSWQSCQGRSWRTLLDRA